MIKEENLPSQSTVSEDFFARPTTGQLVVGVRSGGILADGSSREFSPLTLIAAAPNALSFSTPQGPAKLGKRFYGPRSQTDIFGLLYEGGSLAGLRTRASGVYGNLYLEVGGQATNEFGVGWEINLSEAFALLRSSNTDLTIGRQHYLDGPANNNTLGSLFSYLTFDGVRLHHEGERVSLDLAWLDRYERSAIELPEGEGWLGRLSLPLAGGKVGVTGLHEPDVGTGCSFDCSLPAVPGVVDLYGEIGKDPRGQRLETWGIYFPKLYESSGFDLFIEYARRQEYDPVWSALAYIETCGDLTFLFAVRKTRGFDPEFAIGAFARFGKLGD